MRLGYPRSAQYERARKAPMSYRFQFNMQTKANDMKTKESQASTGGFTLIELLVVIAIISILAEMQKGQES
jgi:prepilin-type N-terminal cleavage/methylation domain-containing protein